MQQGTTLITGFDGKEAWTGAKDYKINTIRKIHHQGFGMLVYQAVAAEEIWFDEEIDPQLTEKARKELSDFYRENN